MIIHNGAFYNNPEIVEDIGHGSIIYRGKLTIFNVECKGDSGQVAVCYNGWSILLADDVYVFPPVTSLTLVECKCGWTLVDSLWHDKIDTCALNRSDGEVLHFMLNYVYCEVDPIIRLNLICGGLRRDVYFESFVRSSARFDFKKLLDWYSSKK